LIRNIELKNFTELFGGNVEEAIMSGWSSAEGRLRHLGKKSKAVEAGKRVSVVYYDLDSGVVDWPENPNQNGGCLVVPRALTMEQWAEKYGRSVV
jgi:hypothetical protein